MQAFRMARTISSPGMVSSTWISWRCFRNHHPSRFGCVNADMNRCLNSAYGSSLFRYLKFVEAKFFERATAEIIKNDVILIKANYGFGNAMQFEKGWLQLQFWYIHPTGTSTPKKARIRRRNGEKFVYAVQSLGRVLSEENGLKILITEMKV